MNTNHHLSKPTMIGKLDASGSFDVVCRSVSPIKASDLEQIPSREPRTRHRLDISPGFAAGVPSRHSRIGDRIISISM
jgi:hypothetical protein